MNDILPTRTDLEELIMDTAHMAWNIQLRKTNIDNWLEHFDGTFLKDVEIERRIALLLLSNFVYYNIDEVRYLCKKTFKNFMHYMLEEELSKIEGNLNDLSVKIIEETIFVPIGNPSESGSNLLYYYRQENMLPKNKFYFDSEADFDNARNIVFVDDVSLSGTQFEKYYKANKDKFEGKRVFFTPLILTDTSKEYIEDELIGKLGLEVNLLPGSLLDEREKVFSKKSYIFREHNELMDVTKKFVECYSEKFRFKHPLGYNDSQLALGFFYNIPNNTLPIFWGNTANYKGVFKRSSKVYGDRFRGVNYYDKYRFV